MSSQPRYRSLFWPMILIGVGLVWFLVKYRRHPQLQPAGADQPLAAAVDCPGPGFAHRAQVTPGRSVYFGLGTLAAAVAILLAAPNLGGNTQAITEHFTEPLAPATSAVIQINLPPLSRSNIHSLNDNPPPTCSKGQSPTPVRWNFRPAVEVKNIS